MIIPKDIAEYITVTEYVWNPRQPGTIEKRVAEVSKLLG